MALFLRKFLGSSQKSSGLNCVDVTHISSICLGFFLDVSFVSFVLLMQPQHREGCSMPAELLCVLWLWSGLLSIVLYCGGQGCFVCNINTWVALCANSHQQAAAVSKSNSSSSCKGRKIAKF